MFNIIRNLALVSVLIFSVKDSAADFSYKKAGDFAPLESYSSVDEFEKYYEDYSQRCLNTIGGGSICLMAYEIWDKELNHYYNKLKRILGVDDANYLKESQLAWIEERDKSIDFNSRLLDRKYNQPGTMYQLMRAGDADRMITPLVKQRVLLLREWLEYVGKIEKK